MKLAVITGCDSGLGKSLGEVMLNEGFAIVVSHLDQNPFPESSKTFPCHLDLRNEDEIESFARFVRKYLQKGYQLEYLINNSGIALGGPIENLPLKVIREVFEVNFFGLISLTQKLIPDIIEAKGRIIIIGSMAGRIALPFLSPYVSTKFALEGFSDSLRRELNPFGVKTILFEPAGIATPIWNKAKKQDISFADNKYKESLKIFENKFIDQGNYGMSPRIAAGQIFKIIQKENPKARYVISKSKLSSCLQLFLPDKLLDSIVAKLFSMDYGNIQ